MREKHTPYSEQFRQQMVELVQSGRQPKDLAAEFGCREASIKLAKCDATCPAVQAMRDFVSEALPLAEAVASLKSMAVKGRAPSLAPGKPANPK